MANNEVTKQVMGAPGALIVGGQVFKTAKWVTRTVLRQVQDVPFYVKFDSPIYLSPIDPAVTEYNTAPEIADIINLETGEYQVLICNTVLGSELRRAYPDDSYVGKMFGIMQTKYDARGDAKADGEKLLDKRYRTYKIIELELDRSAPGGATATNEIDATSAEAVNRAKGRHKAA